MLVLLRCLLFGRGCFNCALVVLVTCLGLLVLFLVVVANCFRCGWVVVWFGFGIWLICLVCVVWGCEFCLIVLFADCCVFVVD